MDDLTRERFWPRPLPALLAVDDLDLIVERQRVLLDLPETSTGPAEQHTRLGAVRRKRDLRLAASIRRWKA